MRVQLKYLVFASKYCAKLEHNHLFCTKFLEELQYSFVSTELALEEFNVTK